MKTTLIIPLYFCIFLANAQTNISLKPTEFAFYNTTGTGITADIRTYGFANTFSTLAVSNEANGKAGSFNITNDLNTKDVLTTLTFGSGRAAYFQVLNTESSASALYAETNGNASSCAFTANYAGTLAGNIAIFKTSGTNVARIDKTGKGFFNGGTQASGADLAESFEVIGERSLYEAGDVLVISESKDRTVEKSSKPYSMLVAGVYATKPGLLLSEEYIDTDISSQVPMGVVGVIPTKVCNEGGVIRRGDLLVSSSKNGYAMKADLSKLKIGQTVGKSLEDFEGNEGKIKVLVNVK